MTQENKTIYKAFQIWLKRRYRATGRKLRYAKKVRATAYPLSVGDVEHYPSWWDSETRERVLV